MIYSKAHPKVKTHLVFISYLPLTATIETHYDFVFFRKNGISVKYWDVSQLFFPGLKLAGEIDRDYIVKFGSKKELNLAVSTHTTHDGTPIVFIAQMTREYRVIWLLRLLTRHHCFVAFFDQPSLPIFAARQSFIQKAITGFNCPNKIWRLIKGNIGNRIVAISIRVGYIAEYNIVFCSGEHTMGQWSRRPLQRLVAINSPDYDRALSQIDSSIDSEIPKRYAVFLDEYLPFHPDFAMLGLSTVEAKTYFALLNRFFSHIEREFSIPVVIAAHPKADYSRSNPFEGRQIVNNLSCTAVRNSIFVLSHASTSVGFAAIFGKPLYLLYYDELRERCPGVYRLMTQLGAELGAPLIDIGKDLEPISLKSDHVQQSIYVQKYLTSSSSRNHLSREIVLKELDDLPPAVSRTRI